MRIKTGDLVEIIAGEGRGTKDRPTRGKVLAVFPERNKIIVEGVNRVLKHVRRSQRNPQGGRLSKEMPISVSNVMLVCPQTNQRTRVGVRVNKDGAKERWCKVSGAAAGVIAQPKKKKQKQPSATTGQA